MFRILFLLVFSLTWLPATSFALMCKADDSAKSVTITEPIGVVLAVPADAPDGTIIWESPTRTINVICSDNLDVGQEGVYFYVNPAKVSVGTGIRVGIRYKGVPITLETGRYFTGHNTWEGCTWANCTGWRSTVFADLLGVCAEVWRDPLNRAGNNRHKLSDLPAGRLWGLNNVQDSNLNYVLTGLDNVRFVPCSPQLSISPGTVDFGEVFVLGATVGGVAASKRVNLNLQRACTTPYTVNARFTPTAGTVVDGLLVPEKTTPSGFRSCAQRLRRSWPSTIGSS